MGIMDGLALGLGHRQAKYTRIWLRKSHMLSQKLLKTIYLTLWEVVGPSKKVVNLVVSHRA